MSNPENNNSLELKFAAINVALDLFNLYNEFFSQRLDAEEFPNKLNEFIEKVQKIKEKAVVKYCDSGMHQKEVAKRFDFSTGRVSQIRKKHRQK